MKTNDCEATLRKGNMPKPSAVTTLSVKGDDAARKKCVEQQTESNKYRPDASSKLLSEDGV